MSAIRLEVVVLSLLMQHTKVMAFIVKATQLLLSLWLSFQTSLPWHQLDIVEVPDDNVCCFWILVEVVFSAQSHVSKATGSTTHDYQLINLVWQIIVKLESYG